MVYESGFTTRRSYSTRPVVTSSYAVTYPTVQKVARVYKTSYPIYSTYSVPRRTYGSTRIITSPIRVVTSPVRVIARVVRSPSPVHVTRTTTRVISSPERTSYTTYTSPTSYYNSSYLPTSYYSSAYTPNSYLHTTPSYLALSRALSRSLTPERIITRSSPVRSSYVSRMPPGYGERALTKYLTTEPFTTFREETDRIRNRAQSLSRDIQTPVVRNKLSGTPFPAYAYEPTSQDALHAYIKRVTNPVRHIAKEVHRMSFYAEPARKYVGKSHLASVRICGDKAYNTRKPMYDSEKVRTDINLMSRYLNKPKTKSEPEVNESNDTATKEVEAVEVEA